MWRGAGARWWIEIRLSRVANDRSIKPGLPYRRTRRCDRYRAAARREVALRDIRDKSCAGMLGRQGGVGVRAGMGGYFRGL